MSANATTIDNKHFSVAKKRGKRLADCVTRALGCWHRQMSRPITSAGETYRACLTCGARRRFDPETWMMHGPYYY